MRYLITVSAFAVLAYAGDITPVIAEGAHNTANTIVLSEDHPDSFRHFAPELPALRARTASVNTDVGLHLSEIEPGLFFVTDLVYQSAFLVTDAGIVLFDAPPSYAERLRPLVEQTAPGLPITHLVMSHGHGDHNGGGHVFADIEGLTVIAAAEVAETLSWHPVRGVLSPTETFAEDLSLRIGGVPIELRTATFHAEDTDVMIYLPEQKFLMAVDTITPGEAPFMNFGATTNVMGYAESFDSFLAYEFEHFLSGHVSVLGTRDDVIAARDYVRDVQSTVAALMPDFPDHFMAALEAVDFEHGNLAYRYAMETIRDDCAGQIIDRWQDSLSVVDLWADSHCEVLVLWSIMH